MRYWVTRKLGLAVVVALLLAMALPWAVAADTVSNNVDASIDATLEVMHLTAAGSGQSVTFTLSTSTTDGVNGCNLAGAGKQLVANVVSNNTAVASVSAATITFTDCSPQAGSTASVLVTPHAVGTTSVTLSFSSVVTTKAGGTSASAYTFASAAFTVNVRPVNDLFANATVIASLPYTDAQDISTATIEAGEPSHCALQNVASVWYRYTPSVTGQYQIDTIGSNGDTVIGLYTGNAVNGLTQITCHDDIIFETNPDSQIVRTLTAGTTYQVRVANYGPWSDGQLRPITALQFHFLATNMPPQVSVTEVTDGATYEIGSVPAAGCSVVDAEDTNEAATPVITGTLTNGLGSQTVTCAYSDGGGLTAQATASYTIVDTTAPNVQCGAADGTWHATDVSISCTASDTGSGLANSADASFSLTTNVAVGAETDNAGTDSRQVCDNANNCVTAGPITGNQVDKQSPVVRCDAADGNWHADDAIISCTATDGGSGLADAADASFSLSTSVTAGTETTNAATGSRAVLDAVGNSSTGGPVSGNHVDKRAPSISCTAPSTNGWYGANQTVPCTATDGGSGLADAGDASFSLATNVAAGTESNHVATDSRTVADNVGHEAVAGPYTYQIDLKAPSVDCAAADGQWHASNVTIACTASDGGSGLAPADASFTLTTDVPVGSEAANVATGSRSVVDGVGNSSTAGPIGGNMVDRKAPTNLAFAGTSVIHEGGSYVFGAVPPAPTCTAQDGGSGLAGCVVTGRQASVGTHTLTATATDHVGNQSMTTLSYTVTAWTLTGFYQPVDMNGVYNTVKNGSTVPLKFEVVAGTTEVTDTATVVVSAKQITCASGSPSDDIEVVATGGTSLRYDPTGGQFIYNWQTPKTAGTCYAVTATTSDGSALTAFFKLK